MRNTGVVMLLLGILGFFYCTGRLAEAPPVPEGLTVGESLEYAAGKWELARYACAVVGGFGLLMSFFPKGR
jgi:hypothetical protein